MGDAVDTLLDEMVKKGKACTHTHTSCVHVHTKIVSTPPPDDKGQNGNYNVDDSGDSVERKTEKRPRSNREAVRKYREKKKAGAASLEDEVVKLRAFNQQLLMKLQAQSALEAEAARLKCMLVDVRGRIEGEIGSFPYKKPQLIKASCLHPRGEGAAYEGYLNDQGGSDCEFENHSCFANVGSSALSGDNGRKGSNGPATDDGTEDGTTGCG